MSQLVLYHPAALVRSYQSLVVTGPIYRVINEDGVIVKTGQVVPIDEDLWNLDEPDLQIKVMLLRDQLIRNRLTPVE